MSSRRQFYSMLLAAGLGLGLTLPAQPADPFADNPFPVPYQQAPGDPALRWAGFQSRVGTYLPTDPYHFWRFDVTNRAEMQDAYWREEMVAATVPLGWSGSFAALEPGKTTQAWRNAVLRVVNLHRYMYGNGSNYLVEDPSHNPELQAAAFVGAWREDITHTLTPAMMPPGFKYTDLAITGAHNSLGLGGPETAADITGFLAVGPGNPGAGHRAAFTLVDLDTTGTGDTPRRTGADPTYSFSTALRFAWLPGNGLITEPPPVGDPFAQYLTWPRKNSFTTPEMMGYTQALISLDVYAGGLTFDASDVKVTVTINGQPLVDDGNFHRGPYNITAEDAGGGRQWLTFAIDHWLTDYFTYVPGIDGPVLTNDYVFEVTVENLRMSRTFSFLTPAQMAQIDPRAFENHTLKWSFTVYDPLIVKPVPSPTPKSEIIGLSTRATIGQGDDVLIAGFGIDGNEPLRVGIRAQGQSLAVHGVTHPAVNPRVEIYQMGATAPFGSNDDWKDGVNWRLVQSFGFNPTAYQDSVAIATLAPGMYTAVVSDSGAANGIGLAEIYALDAQSASRLTSVSTRGLVGTGEGQMIAGFILQKDSTLFIRTQGPSLAAYGVAGTVAGTKLTLYRQSDSAVLKINTGWNAPGNERLQPGGDLASFAPRDAREAALVVTLPAGAYTATVESADGKPGVGIVEVYRIN